MQRTFGGLLLALLAAGAAADERSKLELSVLFGASLREVSDRGERFARYLPVSGHFGPQTRLGGSLVHGLRLGYALAERVSLEGGFAVSPGHTLRWRYDGCCYLFARPADPLVPVLDFERRSVAYSYEAGAVFDLAGGGTRPYLAAGVGGVTYALENHSEKDLRLHAAAGLRLGRGPVRARLEVRDAITTDHFLSRKTEHDVQVLGGLSVGL